MRPLETLHNNLCFKNLEYFLTRIINDRHSPNDIETRYRNKYLSNQPESLSIDKDVLLLSYMESLDVENDAYEKVFGKKIDEKERLKKETNAIDEAKCL